MRKYEATRATRLVGGSTSASTGRMMSISTADVVDRISVYFDALQIMVAECPLKSGREIPLEDRVIEVRACSGRRC